MKGIEVKQFIEEHLEILLNKQEKLDQNCILVSVEHLEKVMLFLASNDHLYFDHLSCLTAIDGGENLQLLYSLYSYPYNHTLTIEVILDADKPVVPSMSQIWKTSNWHEREAFDLFGISFSNHPDLRRILLPADWIGHPLRKNYQQQDFYHGVKVTWQKPDDN